MKYFFNSKKLFILSFIFIIFINSLILYGVMENRLESPTAEITLTQRELTIPYNYKNKESSLSLRINWRIVQNKKHGYNQAKWLDCFNLEELNFKPEDIVQVFPKSYYKDRLTKEVLIVLEYNGKAYQKSLEKLHHKIKYSRGTRKEDALKDLRDEQHKNSRLFAIDAGLEYQTLRDKYKDKSKFIIAKGIIKVRYTEKNRNKINKELQINSYISSLSIKNIYVPLKHRKPFESIKKLKPKYLVDLKYGTNLEPYIVSVKQSKH
ncbi:MAG: DUF4824 family protein [Campylobacterota bacterium]|nr:DUF4824 family protein [Campylobacterota bacterium]